MDLPGTNKHKINPAGLRRIFKHLSPELHLHRKTMFVSVLFTIGITLTELLRPWPLKIVFDALLIPQEKTLSWLSNYPLLTENSTILLTLIVISIIIIAVLNGLFGYWQSYLTASVGQKVVAAVRLRVYAHIQSLSHSFHENASTGDLLARLTGDIRMMRELLVNAVIYIFDRSLLLVSMLFIMLWMDWKLTLIALAVVPTLFFIVKKFSSEIKGATRKQRRRESQITHTINEKLSAISVVQAFAREAHEEEVFSKHNAKSLKAGLVTTKLQALMNRYVQVILALGSAAVLWVGVNQVKAGTLTPGDLLVFTSYLVSLYKPIRKLSSLTGRIAKATACGERLVSILETQPEIVDNPSAQPASRFNGEIRFNGVSFSYPNNQQVLRDVSFTINTGESVAIVGESGVGKSTLAKLLFRFYEPQSGSILIDGTDIRHYQLQSFRNQIAVVLQDAMLFNASVRENIAYGRLDASDADIEIAARAAHAHEFIVSLPDGYETMVSERGVSLSGGQRQRITIARAMIQNSPIVILDEPSASLDQKSKKQIESAMALLTKGVTNITITHDLQRACLADRILHVINQEVEEIHRDDCLSLFDQPRAFSRVV